MSGIAVSGLRNLLRNNISLASIMMMRCLAGRRPQRVLFLGGQIRQMTHEGDDFPDLFISVCGAEGGHGCHPDAMFDDPKEFSVIIDEHVLFGGRLGFSPPVLVLAVPLAPAPNSIFGSTNFQVELVVMRRIL